MSSTTAESSIGWSFRFSASLKQAEQPPSLKGVCHESKIDIFDTISSLGLSSTYDKKRLALVWNFLYCSR
jgi:hypothetical protein